MSEKLVTLAIAILKKKMKTNFFCRWRKTFFLSDCSPASEKTRTIAKSKLRKFSRQKFYVKSLFFRRIIKDPSEQEEIMMKRFLQIPIFSSFWARFNFHLAISLPLLHAPSPGEACGQQDATRCRHQTHRTRYD